MAGLWNRIVELGGLADRPSDSDGDRQRHRFMLLTGASMSFGGLVWGTLSFAGGLYWQGLIPFGYTLLTFVNFVILWRTKNFVVARTVQVFISLLLPFLFQWVLGGFVASGCMMIWALLSLVCALSFEGNRLARGWLVLFLVLTLVSAVIDRHLQIPAGIGKDGLGPYAFALNLATVSATVFGLTLYFLHLRDLANLELTHKNEQILKSHRALIQAEKMAALGQLVAGVAHELNTPLGAIGASVGNMESSLDETLLDLPETVAQATREEVEQLRRIVQGSAVSTDMLTSRDERRLRDELKVTLERLDVPNAKRVARALVEMRATTDLDSHLALVRSPRSESLLKGALNLSSLRRNSQTIRTAVERASKIVFALKSYAHPGAVHGQIVLAKISENLETVLTLYHSQIKQGVDLIRNFEDPGWVLGRHAELNQVWTNLVHNALQAIQNKGTIEVHVRRMGDRVVVEVVDSGPGISTEVQARMFEPFYTTKAQGEGTGLGLSISHDIVAKHEGTIKVESRPGRTCFSISLLAAAAPPSPSISRQPLASGPPSSSQG